MTEDKGILIQNIYHMLVYAFQVLRQSDYKKVAEEPFEHIHDLFAALLAQGASRRIKQGLYREYVPQSDALPVLRGRLNVSQTMRLRMQNRQRLHCEYDELSEDNLRNQILKATLHTLLLHGSLKPERKAALKRLMPFFDSIQTINPSAIEWPRLQHVRTDQNEQMLMNLCRLVLHGLLLTTQEGSLHMASFLDEQHMHALFERFVLEYYRAHHRTLQPASVRIGWNLDEHSDFMAFLPEMRTDITLRKDNRILIIDTKYYRHMWQTQHEIRSLRSAHLYQIFAYVKNMDASGSGRVSGLLLYARTGEELAPDSFFLMGGNRIGVRSLDLNRPFSEIAAQLDAIPDAYFSQPI